MTSHIKRKLIDDENESTTTTTTETTATTESITDTPNKPKKIKSKKKLRLQNDFIKETIDVTDYYIENDLRKVYPYHFTYQSYCKGRWLGKTLGDLFGEEFRSLNPDTIEYRINKGYLKVNGQQMSLDYKLKFNDFITHRIHRHEFPVLASPIPIIYADDELLVIDKPPSLPVHACGKFRFNSVISILEKENNLRDLHILHRLDRLTSGIMVMAKTKARAQKLHEQMRNREMHKEYLCRVDGYFPDGTIECNQPIETLESRIGICIISPNGKPSHTKFTRLNYNGKSSTVLAQPITGRMHQIRVHLQYLGYPIVNDNFYNNTKVFGEKKGRDGDFGKTIEQLLKDLADEHLKSTFQVNKILSEEEKLNRLNDERNIYALKALEYYTKQQSNWNDIKLNYLYDENKYKKDSDCDECLNEQVDPVPHEQFIYLHALRYKGRDWSYETSIPIWAKDTWNYD